MIRDLDITIQDDARNLAPPGSVLASADVTFDLPDAEWRTGITT